MPAQQRHLRRLHAARRAARLASACAAGLLWGVGPFSRFAHGEVGRTEGPALPAVAERSIDFEVDIRPIFERSCYDCHSGEKQEGDYRLDSRAAAVRGGVNYAPAIHVGESAASPLIHVVSGLAPDRLMPAEGEALTPEAIGLLRAWIDQGATWPESAVGESDNGPTHWAFQAVQRPEVPQSPSVGGAAAHPVDAFIAAKLAEHDLEMSGEADRTTLIRRLYLAMLGVPPTPGEVAEFLSDADPLAFERLVDKTLADRRYGERWGRHWLDVVRFAQTNGFETNRERLHFWRYRDYVIDAFNEDKPYDQFVCEQIAGDALGAETATGFLVAGPVDIVGSPDPALRAQQRADVLDDIVGTTGTAFLGLTLGCARCHAHKFDPISQLEYYRLSACFAGVKHGERPPTSPTAVENPLPGASNSATEAAPLLIDAGTFLQPEATYVLHRGDPLQKRSEASPGALAIFRPFELPSDAPEQERRLHLARWIVERDNPLTARVVVNRLWQYHFGVGIVDTPNDFGKNGSAPTHPELLDWLASELAAERWSLKHIQRLILTSATWRQSSAQRTDGMAADAGSRLLWRFPPRRLEAEALRDSILAVSGKLDVATGGPGFYLHEVDRENVYHYHPKEDFAPAEFRRMVYAFKVRMEQDGIFGAFDCPDGSLVIPKRSVSTTPLQALNLFNSPFMLQQSAAFAERVQSEAGSACAAQVHQAWRLALNRAPLPAEAADAEEMVHSVGLAAVCRALLNSNEFVFLP